MRTTFLLIIMIGIMTTVISGDITKVIAQDSNAGILDGMIFSGHVGPKGQDANGEDGQSSVSRSLPILRTESSRPSTWA